MVQVMTSLQQYAECKAVKGYVKRGATRSFWSTEDDGFSGGVA